MADRCAEVLSAGTKLGPYEILSTLGAGGMGEVYRARDAKLHRDVAIEVLLTTGATACTVRVPHRLTNNGLAGILRALRVSGSIPRRELNPSADIVPC